MKTAQLLEYPLNMFPGIVSSVSIYFPTSRGPGLHPSNIDMQASSNLPPTNYPGPVTLSSREVKWKDRQPFLEFKGYMLRPRLRPGWTPSWLSTGEDYRTCKDAKRIPVSSG